MNAPEALNILNRDAINAQVNGAIAGWMAKNPNHTAAERAAATDEIAMRIMTSRTKDKFLNSKANRQIRKAHVAATAADFGLIFASVKETVDAGWKEGDYPEPKNFLEELLMDIFHSAIPNNVIRTATFCFKPIVIEEGRILRVDFSMALQNPRDTHDGLLAKEYAVARMLAAKVIHTYHHGSWDDIDYSEVANTLAGQGASQTYAEKYL